MAGQLAMQGGSLLSAQAVAQMQQHPTVGFTFGMKTFYTQVQFVYNQLFVHFIFCHYPPVQGGVNYFQDGYDSTTMDAPEDEDDDRFI